MASVLNSAGARAAATASGTSESDHIMHDDLQHAQRFPGSKLSDIGYGCERMADCRRLLGIEIRYSALMTTVGGFLARFAGKREHSRGARL